MLGEDSDKALTPTLDCEDQVHLKRGTSKCILREDTKHKQRQYGRLCYFRYVWFYIAMHVVSHVFGMVSRSISTIIDDKSVAKYLKLAGYIDADVKVR